MNQKNGLDALKPWLKPALTIFLGLVLLLHPDSVTSILGVAVGIVVALVGCGLLISFFFGNTKDGLRLAAAIILMILGFAVVKNPLSLASQLGRFIGILLVLQSVRELTGEIPLRSKALSIVTGIAGLVLMLVPMTTSRLLISGCGVLVLVVGIGMLAEVIRENRNGGPKDDIIDAQ